MLQTVKKAPNQQYTFFIEHPVRERRPQRFLEIFAAILKHGNYRFLLDIYSRMTAKCGRCAVMCPVYETTGASEDVTGQSCSCGYTAAILPSGACSMGEYSAAVT